MSEGMVVGKAKAGEMVVGSRRRCLSWQKNRDFAVALPRQRKEDFAAVRQRVESVGRDRRVQVVLVLGVV